MVFWDLELELSNASKGKTTTTLLVGASWRLFFLFEFQVSRLFDCKTKFSMLKSCFQLSSPYAKNQSITHLNVFLSTSASMVVGETKFSALTEHPSENPNIQQQTLHRLITALSAHLLSSLIVRPQSAKDVSGLISVISASSILITIRTGGHDMFSRSFADNSVTIDMRDIAYVQVDRIAQTARIGGGILIQDLADQLAKESFVAVTGNAPHVGYVGWSTYGGYGILSSPYGIGVDQILRAKVVTAKGEIIDADAALLKGIRCRGGAFGVIVELTIRVYPSEKVGTPRN